MNRFFIIAISYVLSTVYASYESRYADSTFSRLPSPQNEPVVSELQQKNNTGYVLPNPPEATRFVVHQDPSENSAGSQNAKLVEPSNKSLVGFDSPSITTQHSQKIIKLWFDKPGGWEYPVEVDATQIITVLANLVPGKDRHRIANETAIKPAVAAIKRMLASHTAVTAESLNTLDFRTAEVKGLFITLAAVLRLKEYKEIENNNIVIEFSGIKGFLRSSDPISTTTRVRRSVGVHNEMISWDNLNDLWKSLTGSKDDVFEPAEMVKISNIATKAIAEEEKPDAIDVGTSQSLSSIIKDAKFDFGRPSGGFSAVNLAAPDIEMLLTKLKPNVDRYMLGNQFGLTPAKRFIEKYSNMPAHEVPNLDMLKKDTDFNGFMITVAGYFSYTATQATENQNVVVDARQKILYGYQGRNQDINSVVKWDDMLAVFEKVKGVAAR